MGINSNQYAEYSKQGNNNNKTVLFWKDYYFGQIRGDKHCMISKRVIDQGI